MSTSDPQGSVEMFVSWSQRQRRRPDSGDYELDDSQTNQLSLHTTDVLAQTAQRARILRECFIALAPPDSEFTIPGYL